MFGMITSKRKKMEVKTFVGVVVVAMLVFVSMNILFVINWNAKYSGGSVNGEMNTFSSIQEIKEYIDQDDSEEYYLGYVTYASSPSKIQTTNRVPALQAQMSGAFSTDSDESNGGSDYSSTNVQVEGVDEGDIVKNDGKFAYIVSSNRTEIYILQVYPPERAKILSTINVKNYIREIYLKDDYLVVLGYGKVAENYALYSNYRGISNTFVNVYKVSNHNNPVLFKSVQLGGNYLTSRLIGNYFYLIVREYADNIKSESDLPAPPEKIHYVERNDEDTSYYFTNVISINVRSSSDYKKSMIILLGSSSNIYVSVNNIYITNYRYNYNFRTSPSVQSDSDERAETTEIYRIAISKGYITYESTGSVPGRALNRFSMDEHNGYFRIATSSGRVSRHGVSRSINEVFVLDRYMNVVGEITDIAPGETIYSARFMGDRGYLVTFKKVDPFFVVDLSEPTHPRILGELKIPGYSNYLHPYDRNHVIGIGKDTVEGEGGNFAWYQGVKISLFDVTDVKNPKELSKFIIGDRGTESDALYDPHAFLFSRDKNLLVIPILLAEIDESKYPNSASDSRHGDYTWSGAYVFDLSAEKGIQLRGRITHVDDTEDTELEYSYYRYSKFYKNNIKRSFYIEDALYTTSNYLVKANDLNDLTELNDIELPGRNTEDDSYGLYID
jgi:uncharacterized secreted protein with C-terminal beta-propeller domain